MKIEERKYKNIRYLVYTPNEGVMRTRKLILQLHGTGARGKDIELIKKIKMYEYACSTNGELPCIIVSPQCEADSWFDVFEQLQDFAEYIKSEYQAEECFLSGYSMGAYTGWQLLQTKPDMFQKAILCCGGGQYWSFGRIQTEVYAYHGTEDVRVPCEESIKMVNLVNRHGGKAHLELFTGVGHNCWDAVYLDPKTYAWLLE